MSFIFVQITLDIGMVISIFATVNYLFSTLNTANAFSQSGFILNFYPPLAIFGLALSTVSMILIATISGVKGEEV